MSDQGGELPWSDVEKDVSTITYVTRFGIIAQEKVIKFAKYLVQFLLR